MINEFEDLECWRMARVLANLMLDITNRHELDYQFRLKDQISGAAISIMNNIAEGFCRLSNREFIRFLDIALASAAELKSMCYLLLDRQMITKEEFNTITEKIKSTINLIKGLIRHLKTKLN